ncbi:MAG: serine/threonine protein kinase [Rhodospirillales bacterium]|nr:serine/threonine protein kinase [Rhodospirillales bacterium]
MTAEHDQALPAGTRLGDYRLDALIGHGGFGITYRAFDTQLAKFVAIKEYMPVEFAMRRADGQVAPRSSRFADDFTWGRERFLDEARALARFRHVHIVPVLRYFEANGTAYTVMEFEDGHSVAQLLRQPGRRLQPDEIRRLTDGMLSGLGAVHAQGFLHRDIKPSNVIVRHDGVPILIDFGAARQAMGGRTRTLTNILTPQYAPIEQYAMDGKQGPWTDIYSTAAVLHHAIAGVPPPEAVSRVGTDPYRPLAATHADRFDGALLAAIDRGLAFAPEQRPQTISEWRTHFGAALPLAEDAVTQRMPAASSPAHRLGGASRPVSAPYEVVAPRRRGADFCVVAGRSSCWCWLRSRSGRFSRRFASALPGHPRSRRRQRCRRRFPSPCRRRRREQSPRRRPFLRRRQRHRNPGHPSLRPIHRRRRRSPIRRSERRPKRGPCSSAPTKPRRRRAPWRARRASWRRGPRVPISRTANA